MAPSRWERVDVGLVDPTEKRQIGNRKQSVASNHYDSDDANDAQGDGRNRHRGGSSIREQRNNAARDLEASPKEPMGMFYSLEVLDGKDYEMLDKGGNVRIFREKDKQQQKQPQEQSKKKKRKKQQQQQQNAAKIDDAENDGKAATPKQPQQSQQQQQPQPQQDPPNETSKKQKRKQRQKRKRNDKAKSTDMDMDTGGSASKGIDPADTAEKKNVETGHGKDDTVSKPAKDNQHEKGQESEQEKEGQGKKKRQKKNKNKKNKDKQRSKGVNSYKASAAVDDASISSVQQSWLIATGGVLLHHELCRSLAAQQFWRPTPIQAATLPAATLGRRNLVGAAPTGSGKTLAYLLPILQDVLEQRTGGNAQEKDGGAPTDDTGNDKGNKKKGDAVNEIVQPSLSSSFLRALILTPTRELAMQVSQASLQLCPSVAVATLVGGMALPKQARVLKTRKPPVVVATPGRLWEMMESRDHEHLNELSQIKYLVIDEADRMVQQGSFPQLSKILTAVHEANPLDEDDGDEDESDDEADGVDNQGPTRLLGMPGVPGEAKVVMLGDMLERMQQQQLLGARGNDNKENDDSEKDEDDDDVPEPQEMDDDEYNELLKQQQQLQQQEADDEERNELEMPSLPPVQRQTFVYSATLTLPPSASYTPKQMRKGRMHKLSVEGALAEMLEKAHAHGPTKVVDLTTRDKKSVLAPAPSSVPASTLSSTTVVSTASTQSAITASSARLPLGLALYRMECTQKHKDSHLYAYLVTTAQGSSGPCLIFCNSIAAVRRVGTTLQTLRLPARVLHASMQQKARLKAIESLTMTHKRSRAILVATDVAARGLDISSVATVIHYDVARSVDTFIHRAGRTARGVGKGAVGSSVSLVSPAEMKAQERICAALGSRRLFQDAPMDSRLLTEAQERVHLASKIVACDEVQTKVHKQNQWFADAAEEAGLDLDEDLIEDGLAGGDIRDRQQLHQAQRARSDLRDLLSQPMTTRRFSKFLLSHQHQAQVEAQGSTDENNAQGQENEGREPVQHRLSASTSLPHVVPSALSEHENPSTRSSSKKSRQNLKNKHKRRKKF